MQPEHPANTFGGKHHTTVHPSKPNVPIAASRSATERTAMQPEHPATPPAAKLAAGYLLTDIEVAELCGCAVATLRNMRWRKRGEGPKFVTLGKRMVRYKPADVQAFIEGRGEAA
jgi:predicted DNA-binding transcriptional regulator AlpA